MRRILVVLGTLISTLAVTAGTAMANDYPKLDGGTGTLGENNDMQVTTFGFTFLVAITAFVTIMSLLQWRLDKRKSARLAAAKGRSATADKRLGW